MCAVARTTDSAADKGPYAPCPHITEIKVRELKVINDNSLDERCFNFKGLPCINFGNGYVIFDPFSLKKVTFPDLSWITRKEDIDALTAQGFHFRDRLPDYVEPLNEIHLTFILTTDCNLGCKYCYTDSKRKKLLLKADLAQSIANSHIPAGYAGSVFIQLFGGEPTLNFDAIQAITEAVEARSVTPFFYITTNGIMHPDVLEYLLVHRYGFYLSLDGVREFNDINRVMLDGGGTYELVERTLEQILARKAPLKVRSTISQATVGGMERFAEAMFRRGVKLLQFTPVVPIGRNAGNDPADDTFHDAYLNGLMNSIDLARAYGASILTPLSLALKRAPKPYCKIFHDDTKILVTPEGRRTLCYGVQGDFNRNSDSFIYGEFDAEEGRFRVDATVRERILQAYHHLTDSQCDRCFAQFLCNGGCLAENLEANGRMDELNRSFCSLKRKEAYLLLERLLT